MERRGEERRGEEKNTRALSLRACARKASFDGCCLSLLVYEQHGCSLCEEAKGVSLFLRARGIIVLRTRIDLCDLI